MKRWRRFRKAVKNFPFDRWLDGHYSYSWVGDDATGGVRRGKFHVYGEGSVGHSDDRPCQCADTKGPINEKHHPQVQRNDYRNRVDYWRSLVADWYDINLGVLSRVLWDDEGRPELARPTVVDRLMRWLVGRAFTDKKWVWAPHRSKDSVYGPDPEMVQSEHEVAPR